MRIKNQNRNVILIFVLVFQLISSTIFAQVPQKMSYQAVIRDASKALVTNKTIGMRIRIAQGTQSGSIVYTETFTPTTNINGLVSLEIGGAAGFSSISWANGPYFILTDADLTGGTNYTISGYSQLVSVPYALHSKTAESITGSYTIPSGVTLPSPVSPTGSFFYKTDSDILYVSNGTTWLPVSTHGSTPNGTTFPVPTNPGDVFFNTANKNFYYWDGTTWKLVSNIPSGTTLPAVASSVVGDPFYKTDTNILYVFNGTSWNPINGLSSTLAEGSLFVGNAANVATPTTKVNIPLSGFGAPTADVSLGNKNITFLADPLIPTDGANKRYVDSKVSTNLNGPTLPATAGTAGNTFFNTTDKVFYISDGSKWLPVATDGSTPSGPTFPTLPAPGDVFYNTATSNYYYYDGTSWKIASSIPTGTSLPLTGVSGDPFFKTDTNTLYIYSNGAWNVAGLSNILASGSFYVGNTSNIATATTKTNIPLSGFGVPTTDVSMGTQKLTNLLAPTAGPDAANKAYVDAKTANTPNGPTNPPAAGASVGDVFYNTATRSFYYFDGTDWKLISGVPTGTTLPPTGNPGDTFYNSTNNTLYVYNNGQWNSTKVQANWTENVVTADDYIKNKPTRVSQFTNDAGYLTSLGVPAAETDPVWNLAKADYYTSLELSSNFPGSASVHWKNITNTPTTLLGYGITDAASSSHNHAIDGLSNVTITSKANNDILQWDNVTGKWVNKAFVTAVVQAETDPIVSAINGIVKSDGTNITAAVKGTDYLFPNSAIAGGTKTKITFDSKGLVTGGADATTADIASSTNKRYVTDSQLNVLNNTTGSNTGDQNASQVAVTPTGNISSTNVQNALVELQGDINTLNTSSHAAVTLGTTNGLSLAGQQLSMATATPVLPGAMSAADKAKLDGIAAGAKVNVQADWNQATITADDYIKNKPVNVGSFINNVGYLTSSTTALSNYYTKTELSTNFAGSASVEWLNLINTPFNMTGIAGGDLLRYNAITSKFEKFTPNYLTSTTLPAAETDPVVAKIKGIVKSDGTTISGAMAGTDYVDPTTTLTINGTTHDLSTDRSFNVGTVTSVTTAGPLSVTNGTTTPNISISQAGAATSGYLSTADWNAFNSKQAALGFTPENTANKSNSNTLGNSSTLYPTQNAVKTYVDNSIAASTIPDATTLTKGKVQLAGDLAGTAAAPTVPGLALKEPTIVPGTTSQYYRGDKTWQTLDKSVVGLGNVDNTSDANKLISIDTKTYVDNQVGNYYTKINMQTSGGALLHFDNLTNKPTTLAGYGITDAALATHNHTLDGLSNITITGKANNDILQWDNVAGKWVNKAWIATVVGAEADPIVKAINGIVKSNGTTISGAVAGTDYVSPNAGITGATKTKITYDSKGLVTAGADATTADIAPSVNKNYVTDSQLTVLGNTSGTNTGDQTNIPGNAATVTTNANLSGPIKSVGNVTSITSQTGTGTKFVVDNSPTLITPIIGVATATSINKLIITVPTNSAVLTIADGKTLTVSGNATLLNGTQSGINTGDQNASQVSVTPSGNISSTNVQAALSELQGDINILTPNSHVPVTIGTANGLSLNVQEISLITATPAFSGAMSAADKSKLDGIEVGAKVNVQADWSEGFVTADDYIKNKPTIVSAFTNDAGYLTSATLGAAETDPVWTLAMPNYYTKLNMQTSGQSLLHWDNITNKPTTLVGFGITDAMSTSHVANSITALNITNWNTAYGWGDHAAAGYLKSFTESDPIVKAINGIVKSNGTTIAAATAGTDYVSPNAAITGATKTKITYDSKGLVTAGADATTADIAASANKNYVTDSQLTVLGNTSGTNTGDQTLSSLGAVPTTRSLTINGVTHDLSADRSYSVGTVTNVTATGPLSVTNGTTTPNISMTTAGSSSSGYLTSTDWNTFNNKQAALGFTPENITNKSSSGLLGISNTLYPTQGAVKTYVDNQITTNATPDATNLINGKVRLAGDLSGTAAAPTVPGLALKEPTIIAGTVGQYYRGDKTWQALDKIAVGLGNVDNTSDKAKPVSDLTQLALDLKEDLVNKSTSTTLGSSNVLYPTQNAVKSYVDNQITTNATPDATTILKGKVQLAGDLSGTAAAPTVPGLALKEPTVLPGTTSQYYRGDKTWQTLDKAVVGLGNVDNTSDMNKPVSTATSAALALKEDVANKSTSTTLGNSNSLYPTQNAVKSYVDNAITTNATPDATTVSKGKVQLAGDLGGTAAAPSVLKINGAALGSTTATNANILIANGSTWDSKAMSGDVTMTNAGVTTIGAGKVKDSKLDKANIPISGFGPAASDVSLGSQKITDLATPTLNTDAANKKYVDDALVNGVPGKLYQGTAADIVAFNSLTWSTILAGTDKGSSIPSTVCTLDLSQFTWIAFPKAWGAQNFFFKYGGGVYAVFDGYEKRMIPAATTGSVDYQVWVFKTVPSIPVDLIVNN